jgi:3-hydroxyacyl-CoA dehydrogenase
MSVLIEQHHAGILTLEIDNPPVNAMSVAVRSALLTALERASTDSKIRGVVLFGGGKTFVAGADIREFGKPPQSPSGLQIYQLMDSFRKPILAALHGTALGGGLELALVAHYRIALSSVRVGMPEVNVGLIPGGGGTQRLPRIVGVETALDLITSGRQIDGRTALQLGIVDKLVDADNLGSLVTEAVSYARDLGERGMPPRRIRDERSKLEGVDKQLFPSWRDRNARKWGGLLAPWRVVDCIEAACTTSWDEANAFERRAFEECKASPERAALSHIFFAERAAAKINSQSVETKPQVIGSTAIIGAGAMGGGIAMVFANSGIPVRLVDTSQEALGRGRAAIEKSYDTSVKRGSMDRSTADQSLARISGVMSYDEISDSDLVIEAVFENLAVKQDVFRRLDKLMKPSAILASNTSTLDIDKIAAVTERPEAVIGMHFFSPANVMKLLEVIRGKHSSQQTVASIMGIAKPLGKVGVLAGNCHGFIGNRILYAYGREADFLLEEGATPWQIDKALQDFGLPMGLYLMRDMAGLDIGWSARKEQAPSRPKHLRYSTVADRICELGRFGQKTGAGYYRYQGRTPTPDPQIEALIAAVADEAGIKRRAITDAEIMERVMLAMVNEGAKIVGESIAQRASDIDVTYVYGYGFPRHRGGPMYWAEQQGLAAVLEIVRRNEELHGPFWSPAPLLEKAAALGSWAAAELAQAAGH